MRRQAQRSSQRNGTSVVTEMKSRQAAKIRERGQSLIDAGFVTLDQQPEALGLARSTTWTILRASHKGSGLSAAGINRMLLSPAEAIVRHVAPRNIGPELQHVRLSAFSPAVMATADMEDLSK
jgi:hypothetical protein